MNTPETPVNPDPKSPKQPEIFAGPLITAATILRNCVAGGVFLAAYCYSQNSASPLTELKNFSQNIWITLAVTLVAGIVLYSIHRSVPNICIEHVRNSLVRWLCARKTPCARKLANFIAPQDIIKLSRRRWLYLADVKKFHTHITDWGDYIHLQYCSCWAILAASMITAMTSKWSEWCISIPFLLLALMMLAFGFISDVRKQIVEEWIYRTDDRIQESFFKCAEGKYDAFKDNKLAEDTPLLK